MELEKIVNELGLAADVQDNLGDGWDAAVQSAPGDGVEFLAAEFIERIARAVFLAEDVTQALQNAACRIRSDAALTALAWYCHWKLFGPELNRRPAAKWPLLEKALGDDAGLFNVLVLLSGTPRLRRIFQDRRIPEKVFRDTVLYLTWYINEGDYHQDYGRWGLTPRALSWVANYWQGKVFRVGRLTFAYGNCEAKLRVFRNRANGTVIALSEPGARYRADGQVDGAGGVVDKAGAWSAFLDIADGRIAGNPIDPRSRALHEPVTFESRDWDQVLAPGDPIIEIHIAAGAPMNHEDCGESLRRALEFFPNHFPEKPFKALTCFSWILDAQFEELLPERSNLVRFQKDVYLFPIDGDDRTTFDAVFGRNVRDISEAPRKTGMQKAFVAHVENGGHFRGGGCFLLPEHVCHWGEQFYRRQRLPWGTVKGFMKSYEKGIGLRERATRTDSE